MKQTTKQRVLERVATNVPSRGQLIRLRARVTEHTPLFKDGVQVGTHGPHGPYMWSYVVRTKQGLALGSIYCQQGDDLTDAEAVEAKKVLDEARYEVEECELDNRSCRHL